MNKSTIGTFFSYEDKLPSEMRSSLIYQMNYSIPRCYRRDHRQTEGWHLLVFPIPCSLRQDGSFAGQGENRECFFRIYIKWIYFLLCMYINYIYMYILKLSVPLYCDVQGVSGVTWRFFIYKKKLWEGSACL